MITPGKVLEVIKGIFIALFFIGFVLGAGSTVDAVLIFGLLLMVSFILQFLYRSNNVALAVGIVIGTVLGIVVPAALPSTLSEVKLLILIGLLILVSIGKVE